MNKLAPFALGFALLAAATAPVIAATPAPQGSTTPQQTVNPAAAQTEAGSDRFTAALNYLEANGYTGITGIRHDGEGFDATAWHNGRQVSVTVDPSTHTIQPKS